MPPSELRMSFADPAALVHELATNLRHGRAFLLGQGGVEVLADCVLVLVHPKSGLELGLLGQVVMVNDSDAFRGVGVQLRPFDAGVMQALEAFAAGDPSARGNAEIAGPATAGEAMNGSAEPGVLEQPAAPDDGVPLAQAGDQPDLLPGEEPGEYAPVRADDAALGEEEDFDEGGDDASEDDGDADYDDEHPNEQQGAEGEAGLLGEDAGGEALEGEGEGEGDGSSCGSDLQRKPRRHEQLRKLNATQQHKLARIAELNDRVLLERIYGKSVWEGLLQNPKLTLPEVARIARKGSVPRPLIEQIVDNNAWIQSPLVRRALLSNPRVSSEGIMKLLRMTPRHELKLIYKTNTYSTQVREAARKVLDL